MRYFISDLHLFHTNILRLVKGVRFGGQEFFILKNLKKLSNKDTLYVLGDFAWTMKEENLLKEFSRLPFKKVLIRGNHDFRFKGKLSKIFDDVYDFLLIDVRGKNVLLSHFPALDLRTFRFSEKQMAVDKLYKELNASLLLHGHVHWNAYGIFCGCHLKKIRCLNVNVEFRRFQPISEAELPI